MPLLFILEIYAEALRGGGGETINEYVKYLLI